jgi:hypothetical protein
LEKEVGAGRDRGFSRRYYDPRAEGQDGESNHESIANDTDGNAARF